MKLRAAHWSILSPVMAFIWSVAGVWAVLPAVMQDEYIYSTQARFVSFADQLYPNYLFSWLYSSTSSCGEGFYDCGKSLNAAFFAVTLTFIWLIANRLFNPWIASFVATIAALSSLHPYVSFFMPESMYFAFISLTIWLALRAARLASWSGVKGGSAPVPSFATGLVNWLLVGLALGLTSLVKPHALFAVPAFVLFAFIIVIKISEKNWGRSLASAGVVLGTMLLTKFGLGFAFAGIAGITLFGGSYTDTIGVLFDTVALPASPVHNLAAGVGAGGAGVSDLVSAAAEVVDPTGLFFGVSGLQLLLHAALVLLIAGVPLLLSLRVSKTVIMGGKEIGDQSAFVMLIGFLVVSMVIVVALFEGAVTALGDDHTWRIITRYYEFLFPYLMILAFSFERFVNPKIVSRLVQSVIVIAAILFAAVYVPTYVERSFADSVLINGLLSSAEVSIWLAVMGIIAVAIWLGAPTFGSKVFGWFTVPIGLLITGLLAQTVLLSQVGVNEAYFDVAGQQSKPLLTQVEGSKILVAGTTRTEVFTSKFWIDKPYIQDLLVKPNAVVAAESLADVDYVLLLGSTTAAGENLVLTSGEGYSLVKISH